MNTRNFASGLGLSAALFATSLAAAQASAPQGARPLPWGPPVPGSLHGATATLRARALEHCIRTRIAKGLDGTPVESRCRHELAGTTPPSQGAGHASR